MNPLLLASLAWFLGLLTPGIVEAIARPRRRSQLLPALKSELSELRFKVALVADRMRSRTGTMDEDSLSVVSSVINSAERSESDATAIAGFKKLLAAGTSKYVTVSNAQKGRGSPYPVPYELPFLESRLADLTLFTPAMQERLHRVRSEFQLFNEQVDQARTFHDRTFTLSSDNPTRHDRNDENYEASLLQLAVRAETLIRAINSVLDCSG